MPEGQAGSTGRWTATRSAGLERLAAFLPRAGRSYQAERNHDTGPDWSNVSTLAPWLHAQLVSEADVLKVVLDEHDPSDAYKFTSEVFWRIYFKGHLEQRPSLWSDYCAKRDEAFARIDGNAGLRTAYAEAVEGRTGIEAFDTWARELVAHGFLHNHARMWFASIWIFTLKLDWTLGADFFLRHLMCADAASNTLNWRWVAGLHTRGKAYAATASNIAKFTARRDDGPLEVDGLARGVTALDDDGAPAVPLDLPDGTFPDAPYALLLHDEGASHEPLDLPRPPDLVIGAERAASRSPLAIGEPAARFAHDAVRSGLEDAAKAYDCPSMPWEGEMPVSTMEAMGLAHVVTPHLPVGWTRDALSPGLDASRMRVTQLVSPLSRATWPYAKAGYHGVRKRMNDILAEVGLSA